MPDSDHADPTFRHYFVDEAGDPSLFNKHGKSLIGKEGCSKFFILGLADIEEPLTATSPIEIKAAQPHEVICLQVVDYYLWAIQRFFERGEDRFIQLVWSQAGLIHDVDDTREAEYGVYYTQRKPLTSQSRA